MNKQNISYIVAKNTLFSQLVWTFAFLGIMLFINVVKIGYAAYKNVEIEGFFNTSFVASNIYMLIIGFLAIEFLAYFIAHGVTRKDYFVGNTLASLGLAVVISIVTIVLFFIEKSIIQLTSLVYKDVTINELELDGNIIGDTVQMIVVSPYVNPHENWILAMIFLFINIFILYLLGWMVRAAFYQFGTVVGIITILIAIVVKILKDNLLRMTIDLPTIGLFENIPELPVAVAYVTIFILSIGTLYVIRLLTKRVNIKM